MTRHLLATFILCALSASTLADPAQVIRATELKAKPRNDATTVQALAEKTKVEVQAREGGWYKVKVAGKEGWVRMTALRLGDGKAKPGDSGVGAALQVLSTGRSGSSGVTVATGVRGLDAADMTNAKPDHKAVEGMEKVAVSAAEAQQFAADEKLQKQQIAYIPAPETNKPKPAQEKKSSNPFPLESY